MNVFHFPLKVSYFLLLLLLFSCSEPPDITKIEYAVEGKTVSFTGIVDEPGTQLWDFGDGNTSAEANPVHTYQYSGYYKVLLTATNKRGSDQDSVYIDVDITPFFLLTGGAGNPEGKTWVLSNTHSQFDRMVHSTEDLKVDDYSGLERTLNGTDLFSTSHTSGGLGMESPYDDEFIFKPEGSLTIKSNGGVLTSIAFADNNNISKTFVAPNGDVGGLCETKPTNPFPASFSFNETKDYTVTTYSVPEKMSKQVTYKGVSTISIADGGFIGIRSAHPEVIVEEIKAKTMRLIIFYHNGNPDYTGTSTYPDTNFAFVLTFKEK